MPTRRRVMARYTSAGANASSAVCLVKNARNASTPRATPPRTPRAERPNASATRVSARNSESTRPMSNQAPEIAKVAAKRPAATSPATRLRVSPVTIQAIVAIATSDAVSETRRRGRNPRPVSFATAAATQ